MIVTLRNADAPRPANLIATAQAWRGQLWCLISFVGLRS